jgi:hypothetical protein
MQPHAMDSLDAVEMVMAIEKAFEVDIAAFDANIFDRPRQLVDWLEVQLLNQRPNKAARALLKKLAHDQQRPELAEGLDGQWRHEQIEAIVREIFR